MRGSIKGAAENHTRIVREDLEDWPLSQNQTARDTALVFQAASSSTTTLKYDKDPPSLHAHLGSVSAGPVSRILFLSALRTQSCAADVEILDPFATASLQRYVDTRKESRGPHKRLNGSLTVLTSLYVPQSSLLLRLEYGNVHDRC